MPNAKSEQSDELRQKVESILEVVNAAEQGDLTHAVTVQGEDAVGRMGSGLGKFFAGLRANVSSIAANANTLGSSSRKS